MKSSRKINFKKKIIIQRLCKSLNNLKTKNKVLFSKAAHLKLSSYLNNYKSIK